MTANTEGAEGRCATCRFWLKKEPQHIYADCRRNPPFQRIALHARSAEYNGRAEISLTTMPNAEWPNSHEDDWCGEWRPRP